LREFLLLYQSKNTDNTKLNRDSDKIFVNNGLIAKRKEENGFKNYNNLDVGSLQKRTFASYLHFHGALCCFSKQINADIPSSFD